MQTLLEAAGGKLAEAAAEKLDRNDPAAWKRYRELLDRAAKPRKNDCDQLAKLAQQLGLGVDNVELHLLALSEATRLAAVAAGYEAAAKKHAELSERLKSLWNEHLRALEDYRTARDALCAACDKAFSDVQASKTAGEQVNAIRSFIPSLFNLKSNMCNAAAAASGLPASIKNRIKTAEHQEG